MKCRCGLFRLVQALIFGTLVGSWEVFLGPFVPCQVGLAGLSLATLALIIAGFGTLVGKSVGMVLTSGPRETAAGDFLNELLVLFRYPPRSAAALLDGTLPLRYCAGRSASRFPTWRLPVDGYVLGEKSPNRKTPAHLVRHSILGDSGSATRLEETWDSGESRV